jgi:LmbE family N-acetylglucosaminyl deacetylase
MRSILLSPHNDDETLFAAYTCLRHQPYVIVCLRSFVEETWPNGPTWQQREPETAAACEILGCYVEQAPYPDNDPPWAELRANLAALSPDVVWAPLPEPGGHPHHNTIGEMARELFPHVVFYSTYTHKWGKTTTGTRVVPTADEQATKRRAMSCYVTQATHPNTQAAFNEWDTSEFLS